MNFEWFLAFRYLKGKRNTSSFLSFIKIMAITGVAIGAGGLLISLAIVHGFSSVIQEKILGFGNHITVQTYTDRPLYRADTLVTHLSNIDGIEAAQEVVMGQGMVQSRSFVEGAIIKGVGQEGDLSNLRNYITRGEYSFSHNDRNMPGLVIGEGLARSLEIDTMGVLTVYSVQGIPSPLNMPAIRQFHVAGIYHTGIDQLDAAFLLMDREHARFLFDLPFPKATQVDILVTDPSRIREINATLSSNLPFPYYSETIYQRYSNIFAWINLQEQTIPFVIAIMVIVAAFNLIGTVLMMILERTKDIGILKTIGASDKSIRRVFLMEGLLVGFIGLGIGILLSLLFYWVQGTYQIIPLPEESYYMSSAPVQPKFSDFLIVASVTLTLCAAASWIPARVAARLNPLKVITFGR